MRDRLKKLSNYILPFLFSTTLASWAMSVFFPNSIIESLLLVIVLGAAFFMGITYARKNDIIGRLLFCLGSALYFLLTLMVLSSTSSHYLVWLANWRRSGNFVFEYWIGTAMLISFFFSFTVYYFSVIRFRIFFLFLIGIVAFILQLSTKDIISLQFIIYCVLFLALYMDRDRRKITVGEYIFNVNMRWYMVAMSMFLFLTLSLCFVIPKPKTVPQIAYIDAVMQPLGAAVQAVTQSTAGNATGDGGTFSVSGFRNESYINSMSPPENNRILFDVDAKEPLYFRIQSWDKYEKNRWMIGNKELERAKPLESFAPLQTKISTLASLFERSKALKTSKAFSGALKYPSMPQSNMEAYITRRFPGRFPLLNLPGIVSLQVDEKVYMSDSVRCISNNERTSYLLSSYPIDYISQHLNAGSRENQLLRNMTREKAEELLNPDIYKDGASGDAQISSEELEVLENAGNEMEDAYESYTNLPEDMPKRIYDLASSITKGETSDFGKASAIERFFHTSGFSYELKQPKLPEGRDYNDFFIFESKKGICVHFASAMVILARAAGLPARYVEGFVADEKDPGTGKYLIRQKDAHAFPEVYIAGYGWMVFEPTVDMQESQSKAGYLINCFTEGIKYIASSLPKFYKDMPIWIKIIMFLFMILLILILIPIFINIRRKSWKKHILKVDRKLAVEEVFSKISALLANIGLDRQKHETPSSYALRVSKDSGILLSDLSEVFNRAKYGGMEPSKEDIINAVSIYNDAVILVKRSKGKPRSWLI